MASLRCLSIAIPSCMVTDKKIRKLIAKPGILVFPSLRKHGQSCCSLYVDDEGDLVDAPSSIGDGFSFAGGKYSNELGRAEEWFERGKLINAYPVQGGQKKAQDPIFGLTMGEASQITDDFFRWFYVEDGDPRKPTVLLLHGFPSQAYSYRSVISFLSAEFHVVAPDWLGFGFSDKPQTNNGFNYTMPEYTKALESLIESLGLKRMSIVSQGFSTPIAVNFALVNKDKVDRLILINPPLTEQHAKLPSSLSAFTNFLFGDIFAQDPLKAGEAPLNECGPYMLDEEDAMVYRRPYLTSGSAGFALIAICKRLKEELKGSVDMLKQALLDGPLTRKTCIIWGKKDRWLDMNGVVQFTASAGLPLVQLDEVGHHAQEDFPEQVSSAIRMSLESSLFV